MRPTFLRLVLRLYPPDWRERYAGEVVALVEAIGPTWRALPDLLRGAVSEWIALASSADRRGRWLGCPSGRRLFTGAALLVPIAVMMLSVRLANVLVPLAPDGSWLILILVGMNLVVVPIAMWRVTFVGATRKSFATGPTGVERRIWFVTLLAAQLIAHAQLASQAASIARAAELMSWSPSSGRWMALISYFTLPTFCLIMLWMQSAARRFESATGLPLHKSRRRLPPAQPLGL